MTTTTTPKPGTKKKVLGPTEEEASSSAKPSSSAKVKIGFSIAAAILVVFAVRIGTDGYSSTATNPGIHEGSSSLDEQGGAESAVMNSDEEDIGRILSDQTVVPEDGHPFLFSEEEERSLYGTSAADSIPLMAEASIAETVNSEHASGNTNPRLVLHADVAEAESDLLDFVIQVKEPVQAVTAATKIIEIDGSEWLVGDSMENTVLVADMDAEKVSTFAIIQVNKETGVSDGIAIKAGQAMQITQNMGEKVRSLFDVVCILSVLPPEYVPPKRECHVDELEEVTDELEEVHNRTLRDNNEEDHHHHHHHVGEEGMEQALLHLKESLRGSDIRLGNRRKLQVAGSYNFQVDIIILVDTALNGGSTSLQRSTIDYVNLIVTGANTIFEPETDTHLNVLEIKRTNMFTNTRSASVAVQSMRARYRGTNWRSGGANLIHALIGQWNGGGAAYVGVICNQGYGFGVSSGIRRGEFRDVGLPMVSDMHFFTHEIGHNFGSGHTHDGYSPRIDACGAGNCGGVTQASATIMSYCHLCGRSGHTEIAYTFGGRYDGTGTRSSSNNYVNTPGLGGFNYIPRRVPPKMYRHVASRGTCVNAPDTTPSPTKSPTKNPTPSPTNPITDSPTPPITDSPTPPI
ncbi:hypothetical protein ACHAXR_003545, partial [Thalassiosira sp. AJA248-18]